MGLFEKLFGKQPDPTRPRSAAPAKSADAGTTGWDAIDRACGASYPDQPSPQHLGTLIKYSMGGPDPLDGISIYRAKTPTAAGVPAHHWHYVTYGFSDLYGTQSGPNDLGESGFGFELTFRLADDAAATAESAPVWPASLLQNLAKYVFASGNGFGPGHHLDANGPIELESDTKLVGLGFTLDPDLGTIETPSGRVMFLEVLGLTSEDLIDVKRWRSAKFFELLTEVYPKGVTVMSRDSLRQTPALAERIEAGIKQDGSGLGWLYVATLGLRQTPSGVEISLSPSVIAELGQVLPARLPFDEPLTLIGPDLNILLSPADRITLDLADPEKARIALPTEFAKRFAETVPAVPGEVVTGPITWRIVP